MSPPRWGSETHMQPWAWHLGMPWWAADARDTILQSGPTKSQCALNIYDMFAHNVPAYIATRKWNDGMLIKLLSTWQHWGVCGVCLFLKRISGNEWHRLLMNQMSFLSHNEQSPSSEGKSWNIISWRQILKRDRPADNWFVIGTTSRNLVKNLQYTKRGWLLAH